MRQAALRSSIALAATALASLVALAAPPAPEAPREPASAASTAVVAPSKPLADACPAQLAVKQTVSDPIAGWTALDQQGSYPFVRVAFYPGPPVDGNLIVPTLEYKGQAGLHDTWDLPRREGGSWMTCSYANTTATVARKLADDTDHCRADYDGRFMTLVVKHWACGVKRTMPPPVWSHARPRSGPKPAGRAPVKRVE
jgi:hypothetical protein